MFSSRCVAFCSLHGSFTILSCSFSSQSIMLSSLCPVISFLSFAFSPSCLTFSSLQLEFCSLSFTVSSRSLIFSSLNLALSSFAFWSSFSRLRLSDSPLECSRPLASLEVRSVVSYALCSGSRRTNFSLTLSRSCCIFSTVAWTARIFSSIMSCWWLQRNQYGFIPRTTTTSCGKGIYTNSMPQASTQESLYSSPTCPLEA